MKRRPERVSRLSCVRSPTRVVLRTVLLVVAAAVVLAAAPRVASADPILDQSFASLNDAGASVGASLGDGRYVGQTFTAGRTGLLSGVNIDVNAFSTSLPLSVAIRAVDASGLPTSTILGETLLDSSSSPLSRLITFPHYIQVTAGTQYAIVAQYQGAPPQGAGDLGLWIGSTGDAYPRGHFVFYNPSYSPSWGIPEDFGFTIDLNFRTYVSHMPTSKEQCKPNGWRNYAQFKNEGDCVSFVATGGKNPPSGS